VSQLPNLFVFLMLVIFSLILLTGMTGDEPEWAVWTLAILGVASAIASSVLLIVIAKSMRYSMTEPISEQEHAEEN